MLERKFASIVDRTRNHRVMSQTRSPLSHPGGAILKTKAVMGALVFNPLPDMAILGSSNSAGNKDLMSKIWTNG